MDILNGDHAVSRQRQQELLQEAENRRLARALRESRKASHEHGRARRPCAWRPSSLALSIRCERVAANPDTTPPYWWDGGGAMILRIRRAKIAPSRPEDM